MKVKTLRSASLAAALAVVFALSALIGAGSAAAAPKTVNGSVGPGFTISLKLAGKKVKKLKATTYKFKITDKSSSHNFHLRGPGLQQGHHERRLQRHEDGHDQAQEGDAPLHVRSAPERDEGQLQGRLTASSSPAPGPAGLGITTSNTSPLTRPGSPGLVLASIANPADVAGAMFGGRCRGMCPMCGVPVGRTMAATAIRPRQGGQHAAHPGQAHRGRLHGASEAGIIERLTDAMVAIQGEEMRSVTWCLVEEVASGEWGFDGQTLTADDVKALARGGAPPTQTGPGSPSEATPQPL